MPNLWGRSGMAQWGGAVSPTNPSESENAFTETFDAPADPGGRGGDLDPALWGTSRFAPNNISGPGVNFTREATMASGDEFPPDDTQIVSGQLRTGIVIQYYGINSYMIRQPFDFDGRTGVIKFDVDAVTPGTLGTWVQVDITEDPIPASTYLIAENNETGPIPRSALLISFTTTVGPSQRMTVSTVHLYDEYAKTLLSPSFTVTGSNCPTTVQGQLNRFEVRLSATTIAIYASDASSDGTTFPNFKRIYEASVTMPFTRGYVHLGARNHATEKFDLPLTHVYTWDNVSFDGPVLDAPRAYEIPDNTTTGNFDPPDGDPFDYRNLGYEVSDGTNKAEGVWSPSALISPLTFAGSVNLTGAVSAQLTLHFFANTLTHTAATNWGLRYRFNGGTWRTRSLTAAEVTAIETAGCAGNLCLVIDVLLADLQSGTNTIDFSTVNVPQDFAPEIANIDLLVWT